MSTALEQQEQLGAELAIVPQPSFGLMPALTIQQAVERYNMLVEFTRTVMVKDLDYGTIPGVDKPCLYKPGAEKLSSLFGLAPAFSIIEKVQDWTGKDHGEPFFYYFYKCTLVRGGEPVGDADGSCNSWEKKYRYREGKRKCPKCGGEHIIAGKAEYGGGWLCWKKKGGCGAQFPDKDPAIMGQDAGKVPNAEIFDQVNTIEKMAQKRALIAAVLIACNASAFYTQDLESVEVIDAEWEPSQEQVRDRKIAELKKRQPASQGPATKPEVIQESNDFLNTPPEPPLAGYEQRSTAKAAEAQEVLKDSAKSKPAAKKAAPAVSFEMLQAFGEIKKLLNEQTGSDDLYKSVLRGQGYEKSNLIPTRDEGSRVYKLLVVELNALKLKAATLADIEERAKAIGPNRFAAFIRDTMKMTDIEFEQASHDKLLEILSLMRELKYGDK